MKYVHSLWSTPSKKDNFDNKFDIKYLLKNFYSYLFSTLLIKKLGYKIDLYCDEHSFDIYSLIPYDNIQIVDFDSDGIDSKFWIWGKIKTQSIINEPFIHIDGDVFMFRDIIENNLSSYSAVIQHVENEKTMGNDFYETYLSSTYPYVKTNELNNINWNKYNFTAYNCGVVGFSDMKLKNGYVNKVKEILLNLSNDIEFQSFRKKYDGMFLIAEQSYLYHYLNELNVKPFEIIPYSEIEKNNFNWFNNIPNKIGYCHMWAYSKYKPEVIEQIKFKIKNFFPEYYDRIIKFEEKYID